MFNGRWNSTRTIGNEKYIMHAFVWTFEWKASKPKSKSKWCKEAKTQHKKLSK